jgi:hypothetical protein
MGSSALGSPLFIIVNEESRRQKRNNRRGESGLVELKEYPDSIMDESEDLGLRILDMLINASANDVSSTVVVSEWNSKLKTRQA